MVPGVKNVKQIKTNAREIFVVPSRLCIVELFPRFLQRDPGVGVHQHSALEVGGRYYKLLRPEWKNAASGEKCVRF